MGNTQTAVSFYCKVDGIKQFREEVVPSRMMGPLQSLQALKLLLATGCGIVGEVTEIRVIGWCRRGRRSYTP